MASISATTAAIVAAVATAASTATAAYSSVAAGENAKEVADYNAKVAENAARDANERGAIAAAEQRTKARQVIARQNAAMSAGGVDASTGTPLDLQTETAGVGELDALRVVNNAQRQAAGYKAQAGLEQFRGNAARTAGYFGAAGSILGGVGSAGYYGSKMQ
ncbi:hypothetical protein [Geobacter sp. AOG2]|uniref:hypothetical protein n=1 Tax=Geobacter sp. AOG2 TaxID=1566347 RepID=UPI001CC77BDE|nr:hypothetical protein [Geobacter sp. AOG2]GFE61924.1 hypothetical protein AOG2_25120 [Geobacter sp. AOG2]